MSVEALLEDRGARYGHFERNADLAQLLKGTVRNSPNWMLLNGVQRESLDMILSKMARMLNGDHTYVDNARDIVGYATLMLQDMQARNEERQ